MTRRANIYVARLTIADVRDALTYYHDNRGLLDQQDSDAEELVEKLTVRYPSKVQVRLGKETNDDSDSS